MIKRISTGIKKLDGMIEKGYPIGGVIGVRGPAGVGKSIFAVQYIIEGAKNDEKSIYINLEEPRSNIDNLMKSMSFGKEFLSLEKRGIIKVICLDYSDFESIAENIMKVLQQDHKIRRIVIDSYSGFFSYMNSGEFSKETRQSVRKILTSSFAAFKRGDLTTLLVLEKNDYVSELNDLISFKVDGLIDLDFISLGSIERRIFIPKMRWTKQYDSSLMFDINSRGIIIKEEE